MNDLTLNNWSKMNEEDCKEISHFGKSDINIAEIHCIVYKVKFMNKASYGIEPCSMHI